MRRMYLKLGWIIGLKNNFKKTARNKERCRNFDYPVLTNLFFFLIADCFPDNSEKKLEIRTSEWVCSNESRKNGVGVGTKGDVNSIKIISSGNKIGEDDLSELLRCSLNKQWSSRDPGNLI